MMRCPSCGKELKNPVSQAGGREGGRAKVKKGFAVAGQPSAEARKRAWQTRKDSNANNTNTMKGNQ
jgi:hypothetical protein